MRAPDRRRLPDVEDAEQHEAHDQRDDVRRIRYPDRGHAADRDHHARHLIDDDRMASCPSVFSAGPETQTAIAVTTRVSRAKAGSSRRGRTKTRAKAAAAEAHVAGAMGR